MAEATDGTAEGLHAFLDWAGDKGEMNAATARALKSSTGKVLEVSDDGLATQVASIDVEGLLSRWETKNKTKYTVDSLATYKARFRQAVGMYKAWLANEPDWKGAGRSTSATVSGTPRQRRQNGGSKRVPQASQSSSTADPTSELVPYPAGPRLVTYDLPLRPDLLVRLNLPVDLTTDDASRIATFVSSLAFGSGTPRPEGGQA